ncbi:MAG TPA: MFS transporter [Chloroflexota bacterium]|nr:MFS transporter [Chloroflexota bacterium]
MLRRLQPSLQIWRSVLREPNLRRVELAFIGFNVAEWGVWIAMAVFAYRVGGVLATGVVAAIQLVPSALFAPVAATLGDRYRRDRVLMVGYVAQLLTNALAGVVLLSHPPLPLAYAVAALAAVTVTLTRPVQGALLPSLSHTVEELTAANVVSGWIEGVSIFAGPLLTGALLAAVQPGAVFLVMAGVLLFSVALTARVDVPGSAPPRDDAVQTGGALLGGLRAVTGEPRPRAVVSFLTAHFFLQGSIDVLFVVLAFQFLHLGGPGVGLMNAAYGLGGLAAVAGMTGIVSRRSLLPSLVTGTAGWGIGLAGVAAPILPALAPFLVGLAGAGRPLVDVSGRTLLQRVVPRRLLARALGVLEGLAMAAMAAGSLVVPGFYAVLGARWTFVAFGAILPVALFLLWRPLRGCDAMGAVPSQALDVIRGIPFFAPLSALLAEQLAMNLMPIAVAAGTTVIREGERGDLFYIIERGDVRVAVAGAERRTLGPGDFFGEIALLRAVPRTATITALTDLVLYTLAREDFLEALTGHPGSRPEAEAVAAARLETSGESA